MPSTVAQACLLKAAEDLFYREGARAVGVEAVIERAGVNKMSLYRQFASKDELIVAYIEHMDRVFWLKWDASVALHPDDPKLQILQIFRDWARRAAVKGYRGCPLVNMAIEFPDARHPVRRVVARNKARMIQQFEALARAAGAADPPRLAGALALLIEGIFAASQTFAREDLERLSLVEGLAQQLLDTSLRAAA